MASGAKFLNVTQVSILKPFLNGWKTTFWGGCFYKHATFVLWIDYQFWKVRMNFFVESIDRGICDAIINGVFYLSLKKLMFSLKNLGPSGQSLKIKRLKMIVLKISFDVYKSMKIGWKLCFCLCVWVLGSLNL